MTTAIVIPAYNPDDSLIRLVRELRSLCRINILVIDDGSDAACSVIFDVIKHEYHCKVCSHSNNLGKGAAIKTGLREAICLWPDCVGFVMADADGQHCPRDILRVADALEKQADCLILGVRRFDGPNVPIKSRIGNEITARVFRFCTGRSCSDTQTGLRGLPASRVHDWTAIPGNRYEYEMNLLIHATKEQVAIVEVPIEAIYLDDNKGSHFHPWRDSILIYLGIVRFALSSLLSAALDLTVFTILTAFVWGTATRGILFATVLARVLSGVVNYAANRNWVFRSKGNSAAQAAGYLLLFISLMLGSWKLVDWLHIAGIPLTPAKAIVDSALFFISYLLQKKVIFRFRPEQSRQGECV